MADRRAMSLRSFWHRYASSVGLPPAKSLEEMRVDVAKNLLVETDRSVKAVAALCGFRDQEEMRRAIRRHLATSPSRYQVLFLKS